MSDLTQYRDHARFMASREHAPGCPPAMSRPTPGVDRATGLVWCRSRDPHPGHDWTQTSRFSDLTLERSCQGICGGCVSPKERELWKRLADEVDEYLHTDDEPGLFEAVR